MKKLILLVTLFICALSLNAQYLTFMNGEMPHVFRERHWIPLDTVENIVVGTLQSKQEVYVLDYNFESKDYLIAVGSDTGWIHRVWIEKTPEVKKLIETREKTVWVERYGYAGLEGIEKWGIATYKRLKSGQIRLGDTKSQVIFVLGDPNSADESIFEFGVHETFVYNKSNYKHDMFLFENGILTSIHIDK